jgi:prepilin-type N-terminal cleavage/methylation domain-containing protein
MRNGFTLVELSIVLVIIGLLTGGILVGQSMVESAKTSRGIQKISSYESAITQFFESFKQIPGDSNLFIPHGDNDRRFDSTACNGVYSGSDYSHVWAHLSDSGMIDETYVPYQPAAPCGGTHTSYDAAIGEAFPQFSKTPVSALTFSYSPSEGVFSAGALSSVVIAMDAKVDNGNLDTGNYFAFNDTWDGFCASSSETCQFSYYPATGTDLFTGNRLNRTAIGSLP